MSKKITWEVIYKDFRQRHPNMKKLVTYWRPYSYATIKLYFNDGMLAIYNYDNKKATFLKERWIKD